MDNMKNIPEAIVKTADEFKRLLDMIDWGVFP